MSFDVVVCTAFTIFTPFECVCVCVCVCVRERERESEPAREPGRPKGRKGEKIFIFSNFLYWRSLT